MARMNWEKARQAERAWRAERDAPPPKRPSSAFRLRYSADCARCGKAMAAGTAARYSTADEIVHAQSCPDSSKSKLPGGGIPKGKGSSRKRKARTQKLKRPTPCATCKVLMGAGTTATVNKAGQVVHRNGCPSKSVRRAREDGSMG